MAKSQISLFTLVCQLIWLGGIFIYCEATDACKAEQNTIFPMGLLSPAFVAVLQCVGSAGESWKG